MAKQKFLIPLIFFLLAGTTGANSRVPFSRPGNMMRIPSVDNSMFRNLFSVDVSSEMLPLSQSSSAFSINTMGKTGFQYGISFVKPVEPTSSVELGFHFQKNMLMYGDVHLDVGVQDILLRRGSDIETANGLDTKGLSLFAVLSSAKAFSDYAISTHLGFGSGKVNEDSHRYVTNPEQNIDVFLGFNFTTPFLEQNGGINFLTEFDGKGLNIGLSVPILKSTHINFGITRFDKIGDSWEDKNELKGDESSITFGLGVNVPRIFESGDETG